MQNSLDVEATLHALLEELIQAVHAMHQGGNCMKGLFAALTATLLVTAAMGAQEAKPRAYTLVVSGAR